MSADRFSPLFRARATRLMAGLTVLAAAGTAWALQPQPLVKQGSCPSGYSQSGDYCLASGSNARLAVPKVGSCPSGFSQSGDYCLSSR